MSAEKMVLPPDWQKIFENLKSAIPKSILPSISEIAEIDNDPYRVLFSTILSLRTRDEVTLKSSNKLFKAAPDIETLNSLSEEKIAETIYPAAFYNNKARSIKKCAAIIIRDYNGEVPSNRDELLKLPGVGRKTANLTLNLGFKIDAICVDTHVHRISNRTGWVKTKTPDETEFRMEEILPKKFWIPLNEVLVSYGQKICTPQSPWCSKCTIPEYCAKINVQKNR
ncbi:MAG: endonuclease III [Spirochaetales bacterium]|nr:endonuclease III [Spirochaetales bacterium]